MRTSAEITPVEDQAYLPITKRYLIINNQRVTPETYQNAVFVRDYFLNQWKEELNEHNFAAAFENMKPHLKFYDSPAHQEYDELADELHFAGKLQEFEEWYGKSGLEPASYRSRVAILSWLKAHGGDYTRDRFTFAVGQKTVQFHLDWKYQSTRKPTQHELNDDGKKFLSDTNTNKPLWLQKKEQRDQQEKLLQTPTTQEKDTWQIIAEQHAQFGNTHSEKAEVQQRFEYLKNLGLSWRDIGMQMQSFVIQLKRRAATINRNIR